MIAGGAQGQQQQQQPQGPDPMQQQQDQQQVQQGNDLEAAPVQQGMEQQASYDSWQRIKAARVLDELRGGAARSLMTPFWKAGTGGTSGGRAKLAAPRRSSLPTSLVTPAGSLLKDALLHLEGKQPKVSATGEGGLMDQVRELPWSEFGSKAWPDKKDGYWSQGRNGKGKTTQSKMAKTAAEKAEVEKLVTKLFASRQTIHNLHLKSQSDAQHRALDEYYNGILGLIDNFVETYQGQYGLITPAASLDLSNTLEPSSFLKALCGEIRTLRKAMGEEDTHLQNMLDEMLALAYHVIYKLTYLKDGGKKAAEWLVLAAGYVKEAKENTFWCKACNCPRHKCKCEKCAEKTSSAPAVLPARMMSKLIPLTGERREHFTPEEDKQISEAENQWIEPPIQTDATPMSSLLASPGKQGLLGALAGGGLGAAAGGGLGYLLGHPGMGAAIGGGAGALLGGGHQAEKRWHRNEHMKEMMRRLEPGATKRDYSGQQMLLNALENRFGGEEKMGSEKTAGRADMLMQAVRSLMSKLPRGLEGMEQAGERTGGASNMAKYLWDLHGTTLGGAATKTLANQVGPSGLAGVAQKMGSAKTTVACSQTTSAQDIYDAFGEMFGDKLRSKRADFAPLAAGLAGSAMSAIPSAMCLYGGATAPQGYGVQGALGGAARGTGTAVGGGLGGLGGAMGGALLAKALGMNPESSGFGPMLMAGGGLGAAAGGYGGYKLTDKLLDNPGLDRKKKEEREDEKKAELDVNGLLDKARNWYGGLSDTQKSMLIGGGIGAGAGVMSLAPEGAKRGIIGGGIGAGAGYALAQPEVQQKIHELLSKIGSFYTGRRQPDTLTTMQDQRGDQERYNMSHAARQPVEGFRHESEAVGTFANQAEQHQAGQQQQVDAGPQIQHYQPAMEAPPPSAPPALSTKMSFCRGFVRKCETMGMTPPEIVKAAEAASQLDPIIAEDLEPLTKQAGGIISLIGKGVTALGEHLMPALKGIGSAAGRIGTSAVGEDAARVGSKLMSREAPTMFDKGRNIGRAVGGWGRGLLQGGEELAEGHPAMWGSHYADDIAKMKANGGNMLGELAKRTAAGGVGALEGSGFGGLSDDAGITQGYGSTGGALAGGIAGFMRPQLLASKGLAPLRNAGFRSGMGGLLGEAANQAGDLTGFDHPDMARVGRLVGAGTAIPGVRRGMAQLGEETLGRASQGLTSLANNPNGLGAMEGRMGDLARKATHGVAGALENAPKQLGQAADYVGDFTGKKMLGAAGVTGLAMVGNQYKQGFQAVQSHVNDIASKLGVPTTGPDGKPLSMGQIGQQLTQSAEGVQHLREQATQMAQKDMPATAFGPDGQLTMQGLTQFASQKMQQLQQFGGEGLVGQVMQWFGNMDGTQKALMIASIIPLLLGMFTGNTGMGAMGSLGMLGGAIAAPHIQNWMHPAAPQQYQAPAGMQQQAAPQPA